MTIQEAISKAQESMKLAAQAFADKGAKHYSAEMHATAAGLAMSKVLAEVEGGPSAKNCSALIHALYNHSAWRQKWEKAKIFEVAAKRVSNLEGLLAELDEEDV